jgi:hypothetical protein
MAVSRTVRVHTVPPTLLKNAAILVYVMFMRY